MPPNAATRPATPPGVFDADVAWALHPGVAVRPEPFGALLYDFRTRRLTFLKDRRLLDVVTVLADHPSALAACDAAGIAADDVPRYVTALARLAGTDMLVART